MMIKAARILVVFGIALFGLRGVFGVLPPLGISLFVVLLLGGVGIIHHLCLTGNKCLIGELACRRGLLTEECVGRILALQGADGGRFGEIAVQERYLSAQQVEELLDLQGR